MAWIDDQIAGLYDKFGYILSEYIDIKNRFGYLGDQIAAENWSAAESECDFLKSYFVEMYYHIGYIRDYHDNIYKWFLDNWPDEPAPPEVTMDAILSAMLSADPAQVEYFVGLVDAYRQSIWNRPFNKDFFAALGRGFMQWP